MRRGNPASEPLLERAVASRSERRNLLDHLQSDATDQECLAALESSDPVVVHTAIRCLAKRNAYQTCLQALDVDSKTSQLPLLRPVAMMHQPEVVDGLIGKLAGANAETRREILSALCRLHFQEGKWTGDSWGIRPDTRGPYYQPEPWSETTRIAKTLKQALGSANSKEAAALIERMSRNRTRSHDTLEQILRLAESNGQLQGLALAQLAISDDIQGDGVVLVLKTARQKDASATMLKDAIVSLLKLDNREAPDAILTALSALDLAENAGGEQSKARQVFTNSESLETFVSTFEHTATYDDSGKGIWADIALLSVASRKNASPEARETAKKALEKAWLAPNRRGRLINAAIKGNNHFLDDKILTASKDQDAAVARIAKSAIKKLKHKPAARDDSPKICTLYVAEATAKVVAMRGDASLGKQMFAEGNCAACHNVDQKEVQKGPFLGNIATTYKRAELAAAVLEPSKTIAQ